MKRITIFALLLSTLLLLSPTSSAQLIPKNRGRNYTAAATNDIVVAGVAGKRIYVSRLAFICNDSIVNDVAVTVGFGTTTTPTNAANDGLLLSNPGIPGAVGGGNVESGNANLINSGFFPFLGVSGLGEALLLTASDPGGGSCSLRGTYFQK